ncbi:MAG: hypothetical protein EXR77_17255 [Myxococcales bacterium]|nr:hypothetical protein [Myxococcales bacterium]
MTSELPKLHSLRPTIGLTLLLPFVMVACLNTRQPDVVVPVGADALVRGADSEADSDPHVLDASTGEVAPIQDAQTATTVDVQADTQPPAADAVVAACVSDQACAALLKPAVCQYARCLAVAGAAPTCQLLAEKDNSPCGGAQCLVEGGVAVLHAKLCNAGVCAATVVTTSCDDNDLCTADQCIAATGCAHAFVDCADSNPCTKDSCASASGCEHLPADASPCEDGNLCTLNDTCNQDSCQGGATKACAQENPCLYASCVAASGKCVGAPLADGAVCDDGNSCTPKDACKAGACLGTGNACDDGDACTTDGCAGGGCQHTPYTGPCDLDGSQCTADACLSGQCLAGLVLKCEDSNPCTIDSCVAATGCVWSSVPFATPCGSGKWCGQGSQKNQCVSVVMPTAMSLVPGGTYTQGCNAAVDPWCNLNEKPPHPVALASFFIDTNEVTVANYQACVSGGACVAPATGTDATWGQAGKSQHPVNYVNWQQAAAYCVWAGGGRLCSEAEWEFAARGSDGRRFPWGNSPATGCDLATWGGCGGLQPVGQLPKGKSPFGVNDMAGNVREWTADWYAGNHYAELSAAGTLTTAPTGPKAGNERVMRGGYFQDNMPELRTSARAFAQPATSAFSLGIRCCRSPK